MLRFVHDPDGKGHRVLRSEQCRKRHDRPGEYLLRIWMIMAANLRTLRAKAATANRSSVESHAEELTRLHDQKTALLYTASHEVRGSLHGIFGLVERLRDEASSSHAPALLDALSDACSGLRTTVQQVLDVAQLEDSRGRSNVGTFDLRVLLREVSGVVSGVAGPDVVVRTSIDPACGVWRFGDSGRLNQILTNLATNGAKSMQRGVLLIAVSELNEGLVRFIVRDEGEGMPTFARARLIPQSDDGSVLRPDRRQRRDDRRSNSGLGLLIARELIESLDGRVDVSVERSAGTVVRVDLPLPERARSIALTVETEATPAQIGRILVVDDAPEGLEFLSRSMEAISTKCDATVDSVEALRLAEKSPYDVVILDGMMSPHDGADLARAMRELPTTRGSVIIVATGNVESVSSSRYLAAGADLVLVKPFSRVELVRAVRRTLAARSSDPSGKVIDLRSVNDSSNLRSVTPAAALAVPLQIFDSLLDARLGSIRQAYNEGLGDAFVKALHALGSPSVVLGVDAVGRYSLALETVVRAAGLGAVTSGAIDQLAVLAQAHRVSSATHT